MFMYNDSGHQSALELVVIPHNIATHQMTVSALPLPPFKSHREEALHR